MEGDTLRIDTPAEKISWAAKLDGKPVPVTGPGLPEGMTIAYTKLSDDSLTAVRALHGKAKWTGTQTLSVDGKTMTVDSEKAGVKLHRQVWEKQ